jgi:hypothetical protein
VREELPLDVAVSLRVPAAAAAAVPEAVAVVAPELVTAVAVADGASAAVDALPAALAPAAPAAAAAAASAGTRLLPRGWQERFSATRQAPYYVHESLGKTQWHLPADDDVAPSVPAVLPPGWTRHVDDDGHAFFSHEPSGESAWLLFWQVTGADGVPFFIDVDTHAAVRERPAAGDAAVVVLGAQ